MFPTRELPAYDVDGIAEWLDGVVDCGFDHVIAADHVLGVDPAGAADWAGSWPHPNGFRSAYTHEDTFHEPFVLLAYLAARCDLELVTGVLVLPQRQTVLVAKQAAELDILSRGRLRLGIGVGWNRIEYEALGIDFAGRGRRMDEQIAVLRRLWTEPVVDVDIDAGQHRIRSAGLQTLPVQRPIPLWIGGDAPPVLERVGRLGDGWYGNAREAPGDEFAGKVAAIRQAAAAAGRDPDAIGVEARQLVPRDDGGVHDDRELAGAVAAWRRHGLSHLAVDTMNMGRTTVTEHVDALRRAARVLDVR